MGYLFTWSNFRGICETLRRKNNLRGGIIWNTKILYTVYPWNK